MKNIAGRPLSELFLIRLANGYEDWMKDANCIKSDVDMMSATEEEMKKICGECRVRENCLESTPDGEELRPGGVWGGIWTSRKTPQEP